MVKAPVLAMVTVSVSPTPPDAALMQVTEAMPAAAASRRDRSAREGLRQGTFLPRAEWPKDRGKKLPCEIVAVNRRHSDLPSQKGQFGSVRSDRKANHLVRLLPIDRGDDPLGRPRNTGDDGRRATVGEALPYGRVVTGEAARHIFAVANRMRRNRKSCSSGTLRLDRTKRCRASVLFVRRLASHGMERVFRRRWTY
jgi:hypothetical protein